MKKNKIVFVLVIVCVILFIVAYSILTFGKKETEEITTSQIPVPDLDENQKEYHSKLEALEAVKEEREISAPSVYPDHMIDEKGYFNPDYMEYEKQRIIDSIYNEGNVKYSRERYRETSIEPETSQPIIQKEDNPKDKKELAITTMELGLKHQLFFASKPKQNPIETIAETDVEIPVRVDGTQTVRDGHRLTMRLQEDAKINGILIKRNSPIYGFVKIRPNRVLVEITKILHKPVALKAHDLQDGNEGIYVENSLRGDIRDQVINDAISDINVPGLPQINGVKRLFQRDNRRIKVEIKDDYQILLKTTKQNF